MEDEVNVSVDVRDKERLPCPDCGELNKRAGCEKKERVWRHGGVVFFFMLLMRSMPVSSNKKVENARIFISLSVISLTNSM